jgi:hypothetical protein
MSADVLSTGVKGLDELLSGASFAEFFGEWGTINLLAHRFVVEHSGEVEVLLTQNYGSLDTYLLKRLGRNLGKKPEAEVARSFGLDSTVELIKGAFESAPPVAAVVDPYLFAPKRWSRYDLLVPITAALRQLANKKCVAIFNRATQFGSKKPEGGEFHHSSIPVIVQVSPATPAAMNADLVKHPWSPQRRIWFTYAEVYGERISGPGKQTLLSEWTNHGG